MKVAVIGEVAIAPMISRTPVPELPQSITWSGSAKPPTPTPCTVQAPAAVVRDLGPEGAHRRGGVQHVLPFEQPGDPRLAHRQRAEDQRAVADRLVAGHLGLAASAGRARRAVIGIGVAVAGHRAILSLVRARDSAAAGASIAAAASSR